MQKDFHYYATYAAAILAGYTHEESLAICYSDQLTDLCSKSFLSKLGGPLSAATTQLAMEMADARTDLVGRQDITRIWASFHFLPYDLNVARKGCSKLYLHKYSLICNPNSDLVVETVNLGKSSLQATGIAMHVLADTWAHRYFAGTPSLVINNTDSWFFELLPEGEGFRERRITFRHNPTAPDDLEKGIYTNSLFQASENAIMNLGHGRAGHLPDYSFIRYRYLPAWGRYEEVVKDNPSDYLHAFCQMVAALRYLRGDLPDFAKDSCDVDTVLPYGDRIKTILVRRQLSASKDWKAFGEELSGQTIEDFDLEKYQTEYMDAPKEDRDQTFLGRFILAALAQKSMVTNRIFNSGNKLAGLSVDFSDKGFKGIKDFKELVEWAEDSVSEVQSKDGGEDA